MRFFTILLFVFLFGSAHAETPNIVIIYADDMGYGDLAIQNPESKIPTPNLDQLAREGLRFTDAHSSSGICTPSRYALLTGRYHWRKFHGIVNSFGPSSFDRERLTLPEMLREKGYRTACVGKWHLGWDWEAIKKPGAMPVKTGNKTRFLADAFDWSKPIPDGPLAHGFDYYFGDDVPNFPPYTFIENDRVVTAPTEDLIATPPTAEGSWEARPGPMASAWRLDAVLPTLTEKACEWIFRQQDSTQPFFLYVPLTSPHAPIVPAKPFQGKAEAGGYGDFMYETDWAAGQVLKALDGAGFRKNTLVIFSSDNGPEHYAYERVRRFEHRSMGPLRGLKRDIWEGGHRVPMVARWPDVIPSGSITDQLTSQIDWMATIASLVGATLPKQMAEDSRSFLDLLKDPGHAAPHRTSLVHNTNKDHYAIREGHWLLVDAPSGTVSGVPKWFEEANGYVANDRPVALFDLSSDLGEKNNLAAEHPEEVERLKRLLETTKSASQH